MVTHSQTDFVIMEGSEQSNPNAIEQMPKDSHIHLTSYPTSYHIDTKTNIFWMNIDYLLTLYKQLTSLSNDSQYLPP